MDADERNRKAEEWREVNKEDINRRVAGFRHAYDKIIEEWRIRIRWDYGGELNLSDIDAEQDVGCDYGWVARFL